MKNISDRELIDKYITHCAALGLSADGLAALVRRTRSWGSLLVNGRIGRLRFVTRARIERILADAADKPASRETERPVTGLGRRPP